jgi:hypothetical protein
MTGLLKKAGLGIALAATAVATTAAPADAQRYGGYGRGYHGYGRGGGDVAAGALLGGIVGLAAGAAIANGGRDRYYDRGYYNRGYYDDGYYAQPRVVYRHRYYAPRPIYRDRYYAPRYGYGYYGY